LIWILIQDHFDVVQHLEQHKNRESDRVGEGMKVWTMVADTDCLLDDESMKSIMLLKGIKGTHLIIPRIGKLKNNILLVSSVVLYDVLTL
jgi:hypothetical protein